MLAALALTGCASVDQDDLAAAVDQLHSTAAEGALLARKASENGRPSTTFTWLQSAELQHEAGTLLKHLDGEMPAAGVTDEVDQAKGLAKRIDNALVELHDGANNRDVAVHVLIRLRVQAKAADDLYEALQ